MGGGGGGRESTLNEKATQLDSYLLLSSGFLFVKNDAFVLCFPCVCLE
jgi:hypothetical protein